MSHVGSSRKLNSAFPSPCLLKVLCIDMIVILHGWAEHFPKIGDCTCLALELIGLKLLHGYITTPFVLTKIG